MLAKFIIGLVVFMLFWPVVNRIKYAQRGLGAFAWSALLFLAFANLVGFVVGNPQTGFFALILCGIYLFRAYFMSPPASPTKNAFYYNFSRRGPQTPDQQAPNPQNSNDVEVEYKKL